MDLLKKKDFWVGVGAGVALIVAIKRFVSPTMPVVGKVRSIVDKAVGG